MARVFSAALAAIALAACLPSATPIAYTPHPDGVDDPVAVLRKVLAASTTCKTEVSVVAAKDELEIHKICPAGFKNAPKDDVQVVPVRKISAISPARGDWAFLDVSVGAARVFHWSFGSEMEANADAIRAADAFAALRQRGVAPKGDAPPIAP